MNKVTDSKRADIVRSLVEGNSVRSTARLTSTAKATVLKLLVELGKFCSIYQNHALRNLNSKRIEADEILAYVGAKQKNATQESQGDLWTYTAIDADSRLIISWLVGPRNSANTKVFMADVAERLAGRVQLTQDGLSWHVSAMENASGWNGTDYAQIIKSYGAPKDETGSRRYSPMECTGIAKTPVMGNPDEENVSTSFVERQNLNMRMSMRRSTQLTNGLSRKAENHAHAVSLYFIFYNYCRPHQTLTKANRGIKQTPAMASGLTDHVWSVEEILSKMDPKTLLQSG